MVAPCEAPRVTKNFLKDLVHQMYMTTYNMYENILHYLARPAQGLAPFPIRLQPCFNIPFGINIVIFTSSYPNLAWAYLI